MRELVGPGTLWLEGALRLLGLKATSGRARLEPALRPREAGGNGGEPGEVR